MITDIHQKILRARGEADNQSQAVSDTRPLRRRITLTTTRLGRARLVVSIAWESIVSHLHLVHIDNLHLYRQGLYLDVTT